LQNASFRARSPALLEMTIPNDGRHRAFPAELLMSYPVTPKMNRASFNAPEAMLPLGHAVA